jgi:23S rRNA pseudouridine2605 synthase
MALERLQKIIARAGFASRREAEELIRSGRVTVNGRTVEQLGTKADAAKDHVKVDGKLITRSEPLRYIILYKPKEVMTTVADPEGRRTVMDYIRGVKERIFPVGRLDFHSEGLILLTNDGELAHKVSHPSNGSVKTYHVKVRGVPEERIVDKLRRGINLEGRRTLPCEIVRLRTTGRSDEAGNSWFEIKLQEGRTQQIRKMFKAVGHPVAKLRRVSIGPISDASLTAGDWRELTRQEVRLLATRRDAKPKRAARPASREAPASRAKTTARKRSGAPASTTKSRRGTPAASKSRRGTSARRSR